MRTLYAPLFFFGFIAAALSLAARPLWLLPLLASPVLPCRSCNPLAHGRASGYPGKAYYASVTLLRSEAVCFVVLRVTKASPQGLGAMVKQV